MRARISVEAPMANDKFAEQRGKAVASSAELDKRARRGWIAGAVGAAIGLLGVGGGVAVLLQPPPVPVVLHSNDSTGIVDVLTTLKEKSVAQTEALDSYFLKQAVRYRVGYSKNLAAAYYKATGLYTDPDAQTRYAAWFAPSNPLSPLNVYGESATVNVAFKSVSWITPGSVALVRYILIVERFGLAPEQTHYATTIAYRYSKGKLNEDERAINPLNFRYSEFRADADTTPH